MSTLCEPPPLPAVITYVNAPLLELRPWPEGSHEQGLSFLLSESFLGIGSLVYSGTQHGVRSPYGVMHDSWKQLMNFIFGMQINIEVF